MTGLGLWHRRTNSFLKVLKPWTVLSGITWKHRIILVLSGMVSRIICGLFLFLGVIAGGVVGLVFAVFLVVFMLYRMKKKDEGSYSLDEPKQSNGGYQKPHKQEEFYA
uniref:Syndecan n=1 Tax=Apteryx owenii TaxID=8824 RepID=A0A8B9SEP7_APTOW